MLLISKWFFNNVFNRIISEVRWHHLQIAKFCFNEAHPRCLNCCATGFLGLPWTSLALSVIMKAGCKCFYQLSQLLPDLGIQQMKEIHRFNEKINPKGDLYSPFMSSSPEGQLITVAT